MPRGTLRLAALLIGVPALGAIGWMMVTRQQETVQRLTQASHALSQAQGQLTLLDEERQKLADAYDVLKGRLATTDETLDRLQRSSKELAAERERLSRERSELQRQLEETARAAERRAQALTQQASSERAALEARVGEATTASRQLEAMIEQLQRRLQQRSGERERMGEQMTRLSRAYEALLQVPPAPPATPAEVPAPRPASVERRGGQGSTFHLRETEDTIDPTTIPRTSWKLLWHWLWHPMRPASLDNTKRDQAYLD